MFPMVLYILTNQQTLCSKRGSRMTGHCGNTKAWFANPDNFTIILDILIQHSPKSRRHKLTFFCIG